MPRRNRTTAAAPTKTSATCRGHLSPRPPAIEHHRTTTKRNERDLSPLDFLNLEPPVLLWGKKFSFYSLFLPRKCIEQHFTWDGRIRQTIHPCFVTKICCVNCCSKSSVLLFRLGWIFLLLRLCLALVVSHELNGIRSGCFGWYIEVNQDVIFAVVIFLRAENISKGKQVGTV